MQFPDHTTLDYATAATLYVTTSFRQRLAQRTQEAQKAALDGFREIDICALLATWFAGGALLAAQGTSDADVVASDPKLTLEVKYFSSSRTNKTFESNAGKGLKKDWDRVLAASPDEALAWIAFWPSVSIYKFTNCLSVPATLTDPSDGSLRRYCPADFAPFASLVEVETPKGGGNHRLRWRTTEGQRTAVLKIDQTYVRRDVVGSASDPLWATIYTRVLEEIGAIDVTDTGTIIAAVEAG